MAGRVTCHEACLHLHLDFHHTHLLLFSYDGLGSLLRSEIAITESQIPLILSAYLVTLY